MDPVSSTQTTLSTLDNPLNVNDLFDELLQTIFANIHPRDLPENMSVCQKWNKTILRMFETIDWMKIVKAITFITQKLEDKEVFVDDGWIIIKGMDFLEVDRRLIAGQLRALLTERRMIFEGVYLPILESEYQRYIEKMADILGVLCGSDLEKLLQLTYCAKTGNHLIYTVIHLIKLRREIKKVIDEGDLESDENQKKLYEIGERLSGHWLTDQAIELGKKFNLKEDYYRPLMKNLFRSNFLGREYHAMIILSQINDPSVKMKFINLIFEIYIFCFDLNKNHVLKYIPLIKDPETEALAFKIANAFSKNAPKEEIQNALLEDRKFTFEAFWIHYIYFNFNRNTTETAFACLRILFENKYVGPNLLHSICGHLLGNIFEDKKTMPIPIRIKILNQLINEFPFFRKQQAEFILNLFRGFTPCHIITRDNYTNSGFSPEIMDQAILLCRQCEFKKALKFIKANFEGKELPETMYRILQIESALALVMQGQIEESRTIVDDLEEYTGEKIALLSFFEQNS